MYTKPSYAPADIPLGSISYYQDLLNMAIENGHNSLTDWIKALNKKYHYSSKIARRVGVSTQTVTNWKRKLNLPSAKRGGHNKINNAKVDIILKLHNTGLNQLQISRKTGVSPTTVKNYIKKYDN